MIFYYATLYPYNPAIGDVVDIFFSSHLGEVTTSNFPTPTPNAWNDPRIEQPALIRTDMFTDGQIGGQLQNSFGELTLINNDGALDYLAAYAFDSRDIEIFADDNNGNSVSFIGKMQQAVFEQSRVSIRLRDLGEKLRVPVRANLYLGNNTTNGVEGKTDLKDVPKPRFYGKISNATPVLVNSSYLIYQINDGPVTDITAVYDKGVALTNIGSYADVASMQGVAPSAGTFKTVLSGGYFRLGSSPAGLITCDATIKGATETAHGCSPKELITKILTDFNDPWVLFDNADLTALAADTTAELGLMVSEGMTWADCLDQILASVGAWWGYYFTNTLRVRRLEAPLAAESLATLTDIEIIRIDRQPMTINGQPVPPWKITLNHAINQTIQEASSLAGSVTVERKAWLAKANRQSTYADASIKTRHLQAQDITYDSLFNNLSDAQAEASRRFSLLSGENVLLIITVAADSILALGLGIGSVVNIKINRFGLSAGVYFRITGMQADYQRNEIEMNLWAPNV